MRDDAGQREIVVTGEMRTPRARARRPQRNATSRPNAVSSFHIAGLVAALGSAGRFCARRPSETVGSVVALSAVAYVSLNALGFQAGRHPAPILPQPVVQAGPGSTSSPAPKAAANAVEPAHQDVAEAARAPKETVRSKAHDPIADLIRGPGETTASVTPKPEKDVARAQRALTKLGYGPLKDDGVMGAGTKSAIEKFERDKKLPVKGQASGRTLNELAAQAEKKKG